jgi:hypothetical protein
MIKKAVFLAVLLVALSLGSAFADQIDSLGSVSGAVPPTNVYVNPGGVGDALIYGYYNVRDNRQSFFNVVNTSVTYGVRATVRFIEGPDVANQVTCPSNSVKEARGSIEVLDFHICLTPADVWSGNIRNVGGIATLFSNDDDTYLDLANRGKDPDPTDWNVFPDRFPNGAKFSTLVASPDDTLEGYFLIIAINQLDEVSSNGSCGPGLVDINEDVDNVLFGINYMVEMGNLATFAYDATALGDFSDQPYIFAGPIDESPNLQDCQPDCPASLPRVAPVNYALTKSNIYSTYDLEAAVSGKTELIVTFPTKRNTQLACTPNDIFDDPRVRVTIFDDEENSPTTTCEVSPCPEGEDVELPYEVNVVKINDTSDIFTSSVETLISTNFEFGWINIDFTRANTGAVTPAHVTSCTNIAGVGNCTSDAAGAQVSNGLPAIGYTAIDVANGASTHLLPVQYSTRFGTLLQ